MLNINLKEKNKLSKSERYLKGGEKMVILYFFIGLIIGHLFMITFLDRNKFEPIEKRKEEIKKEIEDLEKLYNCQNDKH